MLRLLALCLATGLASGASAQSLVGKWDCQGRDGPGAAIRTLQEYRASGAFFHRANLAIGDRTGRVDMSVSLRGTWTLKGNLIVEKISTARMTALKQNGQDISKTPLGSRLARNMPKQLAGPSGVSRTRIKFTHKDRFEMISGRIRGTCVRR